MFLTGVKVMVGMDRDFGLVGMAGLGFVVAMGLALGSAAREGGTSASGDLKDWTEDILLEV